MKQEDKELLLKDLCARLPYGVKCHFKYGSAEGDITLSCIDINVARFGYGWYGRFYVNVDADYIKPYLFPISSMTEEQKKDLLLTTVGEKGLKLFSVTKDGIMSNDKEEQSFANFSVNWINFSNKNVKAYIGWFIKNHFDIYGLIPKNLAIDCTNLNIY